MYAVYVMNDQWKTSLPLAIGLHILVVVATVLSPMFLERKPLLPEVYTVDLFSVADLKAPEPAPAAAPAQKSPAAAPAPAQKSPAAAPEAIPPPASAKKAVSIAPPDPVPPAAPAVSAAPTEAISIEPVKTKVKVEVKEEIRPLSTNEKQKLSRAVDELQEKIKAKEAQQELERLQKKAKEELELLKKEAVEKVRDTYKESTLATTTTVSTPAPSPPVAATSPIPVKSVFSDSEGDAGGAVGGRGEGSSSSGAELSSALKQYYAQIQGQIKEQWILPEMQTWDKSLVAILVLKIRRDGTVAKTFFDKKSANAYFDQFVLKAVRQAMPFAPFPAQMKEQSIEVGFRFTPDTLN